MQTLRPILLIVFLVFPALCRANETCLWLNAATAGGVLGGAVTATVSHPKALLPKAQTANAKSSAGPLSADPEVAGYAGNGMDDADCAFFRQPPAAGALHIAVRTMTASPKEFASYKLGCGPHAVPITAIGNEAFACTLNHSEQVIGRVRERAFILRLSIADPSMTPAQLRENAQKAAEIVAGNLF